MAWRSQNSSLSLHPKEKYCTYRARVRCHMKRRGYWGEGLPASFEIHFFFFILLGCFKTCYCSFYQRFFACVLSALLHGLRWIMRDHAARVNGQKSCVANRCTTERLALFCKRRFFAEWLCYILSSKINWSDWPLAKQLGGEATSILSASPVRTDWKFFSLVPDIIDRNRY